MRARAALNRQPTWLVQRQPALAFGKEHIIKLLTK